MDANIDSIVLQDLERALSNSVHFFDSRCSELMNKIKSFSYDLEGPLFNEESEVAMTACKNARIAIEDFNKFIKYFKQLDQALNDYEKYAYKGK